MKKKVEYGKKIYIYREREKKKDRHKIDKRPNLHIHCISMYFSETKRRGGEHKANIHKWDRIPK